MKEQEYKKLYSGTEEELKAILDAIINRNAKFSKMEIVEMLKVVVDESLRKFMESLKLVNFKGREPLLPTYASIGDVYEIGDAFFVCEGYVDKNTSKWRRLCTENDLSAYYSKEEFDEKYTQHIGLISSFVDESLYEYSEDFKNRFITKDEAESWKDESLRKIAEYSQSISSLFAWRDAEQSRVDSFIQSIDELSAFVKEMKTSQAEALSSWIIEQTALISTKLSELDSFRDELQRKLDESEDKIHFVSTEVAILSGAFEQIKRGKQQVLGERYEA